MNADSLSNLRHSCAHLLAAAMLELYPGTKNTIGPAIENGFYYDFDFHEPISEKDFVRIDQKMREILKKWKGFERIEVTKEEALAQFKNNEYKRELIEEFSKDGQKLTLYKSGNYVDLCRGGHVEHPDKLLKHFKLLSVAGAYWRGDEKNKMLSRIYGTAFPSKEELEKHLWLLEEAKKRDHKKLGKELELFMFSQTVGPGLPLLLPNGQILRSQIEKYLEKLKLRNGLTFIWTPQIARSTLYVQSKHWQKYDAMMPPLKLEDEEYTIKPMNCPHHFQIYLFKQRSYRDLPLRLAENATVYRNEKSGEINGLLRVRALTQDDSHWFVPHNQLAQEIDKAISITKEIYQTFGLAKYYARISIRDKENPDKYLGDSKVWDMAEKELEESVKKRGINYKVAEDEAAFYGPKIDFMIEDAIGREWQLTTIQLDFNQPENFDLEYIDHDGSKKRPAVLHIAFLGSLDRFMAILIEHYAGAFPTWLAPVQVRILPISDKFAPYAGKIRDILLHEGIRVELDTEQKTIGYKIRESTLQKVPYMIIIGEQESSASAYAAADKAKLEELYVSVRTREGENRGSQTLREFITTLHQDLEKSV